MQVELIYHIHITAIAQRPSALKKTLFDGVNKVG